MKVNMLGKAMIGVAGLKAVEHVVKSSKNDKQPHKYKHKNIDTYDPSSFEDARTTVIKRACSSSLIQDMMIKNNHNLNYIISHFNLMELSGDDFEELFNVRWPLSSRRSVAQQWSKGSYKNDDEYTGSQNPGLALIVGILVMPYIFSWFVLNKKYSSVSRVLTFSYFGFLIMLMVIESVMGNT